MNVTERVAYLRGLVEGMELNSDKKEGKLWTAILAVLEELSASVADLEEQNAELANELENLYEELGAVEEEFFDDDEEIALDEDLYQVICPTCREIIYMDEDMLAEGSTACPVCGEELEFDLSGLDEDDPDENDSEEIPF